MEQRNGHIVSTLSWETTFDDKALGFDLQNRISQWSKFVMPGELDEVFKQACPEGMALSINSLEIDLGEIEVNDLETQLKKRLETTLKEKLADMLSYPSHNQNLKLTEQSLASMDSLRYFLVNGVMPWNYTGGDLNALVADLFRKQQPGTVDLLRETGTASMEARKRMAWQFDEPNMNQTIRGFEPVSYGQITSLSGEMVRLQHKEQFIRSSVADLGKEIRLWILNYLLSDRGTLFNNMAFMKGILEQMAHRHNIAYSDLLLLVEKAIVKPNLAYHVKGEFITVINMLSQQHKLLMPGQGNKNLQQGIDPANYKQVITPNTAPEELAANIVLAGYENSHSSLLALPNNIDYWLKHAKRLDDHFMNLFFSACRYAWPSKVVKLVEFVTQLPDGAIPQIGKQKIRAIGVAYLLINNEKIDRKAFLNYLLNHCAKATGKSRRKIYDELGTALVALKPHGALVNDVYELMGAIAETTYSRYNYDIEPVAGIVLNLNRYCLQLVDKGTDRRALGLLRQDLNVLVKSDPRRVLRTLRALKNKAVLFYSVPLLSGGMLVTLLLDADRGPVWKAMNLFKTALHEISTTAGRNEIALLERTAMRLAFKMLIMQPGLTPTLFFNELVDEADRSGKFSNRCLTSLRQQLGMEQAPAAGNGSIWYKLGNNHHNAIIARIYEQLFDVKKDLPAILGTLYQHRANEPLMRIIRNDDQLPVLLFNRSFNNGKHEVKAMIDTAFGHIVKKMPRLSKSQTEQKLNELFWQCFIGGGWYRHGFAGLKKNFRAAVSYHYPTTTVEATAGAITRDQEEQLRHAEIISAKASHFKFSELADVIKTAIGAGADTITWIESRISLTEILFKAAEEQGQDPLKMAAKLALSDNEIIAFMRTVDFEHFLHLFTLSKPALTEQIGDLALIFFLFNATGSRTGSDAIMVDLYKQVLVLNGQQANWRSGRDQLLGEALAVSLPKLSVNGRWINKFNTSTFKLSADLKAVFNALTTGQRKSIGKFNTAGFKLSAGLRELFSALATGQHKHIGNLNAEDLKMPAYTRTTQSPTVPYLHKPVDKLNAAELKLPADKGAVQGPTIPGRYSPIDKLNPRELKLSAVKRTETGSTLPDRQQLNDEFNKDGSTSPEEAGMLDNSSATGKQTKKGYYTVTELNKDIANAHQRGITAQLLYLVITEKLIPPWFNAAPGYSAGMLAEGMIRSYPGTLLSILKSGRLNGQELEQLAEVLSFKQFVSILADQNNPVTHLATEIGSLYTALAGMSFGSIPGRQVQVLLYKKVLIAWKSSNWAMLSASRIWQELIWDMFVTCKVSKDNFIRQAAAHVNTLGPAYRAALQQLVIVNVKGAERAVQIKDIPAKKKPAVSNVEKILTEAIPVKNAGMVLLSEYVPALFRHMGLLEGKAFLNADARIDAVHILQYAVTGMKETSEPYLPLNKVLCGLPLAEPVTPGITLDETKEKLIGGMLLNLVGQWAVIGKTSVNGFRGNWLVRDGLLSEWEDKWELVVEPRPYDILINQFPFSYSIIKYQWMDKPLHVKWKI